MTGIEGLFDDEQPTGAESAQDIAAPQPEGQGEPAPQPETATPAVSEPKEDRFAPLSALLDERDKRQAAQRQAEELQRKLAQIEAQQAKPPVPDFYDDPEARIRMAEQRAHALAVDTKLQTSRFLAERDFGAETVKEAYAFFDENPHLSAALLDNPSPFHEAVSVYKRHKALSEIGPDPDAYRAKIEAEVRERLLAEFAQSQPQKPTAPPPSLTAAPSAGGAQTETQSGFERLFGG